MNAIYVMWLRQIKRYIRNRARIISSLGQPLLLLLALGFGLGPTFQKAGQGSYLQFLAPGVIAMTILFTAIFTGIEVIWDRQFGFLKETLVVPVSRLEIMIGKTLGGATVATLQGILVLAITTIAGFRPVSLTSIPLALTFMSAIATVFTALGMVIASVLNEMHSFQLIMNFLVMPLYFLSGAIFPLTDLPSSLKIAVSFNPLSYGVDGLRGALSGIYYFNPTVDMLVLVLLAGFLFVLGSYLFSRIEA